MVISYSIPTGVDLDLGLDSSLQVIQMQSVYVYMYCTSNLMSGFMSTIGSCMELGRVRSGPMRGEPWMDERSRSRDCCRQC